MAGSPRAPVVSHRLPLTVHRGCAATCGLPLHESTDHEPSSLERHNRVQQRHVHRLTVPTPSGILMTAGGAGGSVATPSTPSLGEVLLRWVVVRLRGAQEAGVEHGGHYRTLVCAHHSAERALRRIAAAGGGMADAPGKRAPH